MRPVWQIPSRPRARGDAPHVWQICHTWAPVPARAWGCSNTREGPQICRPGSRARVGMLWGPVALVFACAGRGVELIVSHVVGHVVDARPVATELYGRSEVCWASGESVINRGSNRAVLICSARDVPGWADDALGLSFADRLPNAPLSTAHPREETCPQTPVTGPRTRPAFRAASCTSSAQRGARGAVARQTGPSWDG